MKLFECQNCGQLVYFENTQCERCGLALGFLAGPDVVTALQPGAVSGHFIPLADKGKDLLYCANHAHAACNWLVESGGEPLCTACDLNRTIPNLSVPENLERWQRIEVAKHRLIYSLHRLGLPIETKERAPDTGFAFDLLAPLPDPTGKHKLLTGHDDGLITLNISEADDVIRAEVRKQMGEPYRTLLGHFRHEIAHYYFQRLVEKSSDLSRFREVFGDESADYGEALERYYANGAPSNWQTHHISAYASAHPHEDWAETFAHYLHMIDTLETAYAFGVRIHPRVGHDDTLTASVSFDPYSQPDFDRILDAWLPVTFAVNSLNRSMGVDDLYPFVISAEVGQKLKFIHGIIRANTKARPVGG